MEQKVNIPKKYIFTDIPSCNMCGNPTALNKVMGLRLSTSQGLRPKSKTGIAVSVLRCRKCSLIYSNPLPVPENIQDHYGLPPEDYWNTVNYVWNENYFANEIKILKRLMPFSSGMKSLDIGAGLGNAMISLEKAGFDSHGFEPSEPFYNKAIDKMGIDKNKLKLGQLETIDYPEEEFDFISFGAVLEHVYNPSESIHRAMQWLKPGGIMHIEVPSSRHLPTRIINTYYKLIGTSFVSNISPMHVPFHLYEFGLKSFRELALKQAFTIAAHQFEPCEVLNFPAFTHPLLKFIMKKTNTGLQLIIWLKKQ